jgi:hypothetical protein
MSTYLDITRDALLKINVIDEEQQPSALQVRDSTAALNEMLEEWAANEIDLGFIARTGATDTVAIPGWAKRVVTYSLAVMLAVDYGVDVTMAFASTQKSAYERLLIKALGDIEISLGHVPRGDAKDRRGGSGTGAF